MDDTDEKGCPYTYLFDNCQVTTNRSDCGWQEDPEDALDWVVAFRNDTAASGHPVDREGKFLWVKKTGEDVSEARARVLSPTYQNSRADCRLLFYFYASGTVGRYIKPEVFDVRSDNYITLDTLGTGKEWRLIEIQVGRRQGQFQISFDRAVGGTYDAAVAIDDVNFDDCDMPRPTPGECEAESPFQCENQVSDGIVLQL